MKHKNVNLKILAEVKVVCTDFRHPKSINTTHLRQDIVTMIFYYVAKDRRGEVWNRRLTCKLSSSYYVAIHHCKLSLSCYVLSLQVVSQLFGAITASYSSYYMPSLQVIFSVITCHHCKSLIYYVLSLQSYHSVILCYHCKLSFSYYMPSLQVIS